jgi:hypothetical protein
MTKDITRAINMKLAETLCYLAPKGATFLVCPANASQCRPHIHLAIIVETEIASLVKVAKLAQTISKLITFDDVVNPVLIETIWIKQA